MSREDTVPTDSRIYNETRHFPAVWRQATIFTRYSTGTR